MNPRFINMHGGITIRGVEYEVGSIVSMDMKFTSPHPNYTFSGTSQTKRPIPSRATLTIDVEIDTAHKSATKNAIDYNQFGAVVQVTCPTLVMDVVGGGKPFDRLCPWTYDITAREIEEQFLKNEQTMGPLKKQTSSFQEATAERAKLYTFAQNQVIESVAKSHVKTSHGAQIRPHPDARKSLSEFVLVRIEKTRTIELTEAQAKLIEKVVGRITPGNNKTRTDLDAILDALGAESRRGL